MSHEGLQRRLGINLRAEHEQLNHQFNYHEGHEGCEPPEGWKVGRDQCYSRWRVGRLPGAGIPHTAGKTLGEVPANKVDLVQDLEDHIDGSMGTGRE